MDKNGLKNLGGVHPDLIRVVKRTETLLPEGMEITVTCGRRSLEEQKRAVASGASTTMRSRHLPGKNNGLSHAVDLAVKIDTKIKWDWPLYSRLAVFVKKAATMEKVPIEWGGDWKTFKDGPHFQLPWDKYPG